MTRKELENARHAEWERAELLASDLAAAREENEKLRGIMRLAERAEHVIKGTDDLASLRARDEGRVERVAEELLHVVPFWSKEDRLHEARAVLAAADKEAEQK
jgi:hypothetical protein